MKLPLHNIIPKDDEIIHNLDAAVSAIPVINVLKTVNQDPYFHPEGNVYIHTMLVCKSLLTLKEYQEQGEETKYILYIAALLHDIGKLYCTKVDDNGWISSKGHSRKGANEARVILWKLNVPFEIRERICRLISTHQVIFHIFEKSSLEIDFTIRKLSWEVELKLLAILAKADILGRGFIAKDSLENIELFVELAKELNCYENPYPFPSDEIRMDYILSRGKTSPDYSCNKKEGSDVILLSALPAAGKDTFAKTLNLPMVSYDAAREELGLKHGSESGAATQLVLARAKEFLRNKKPFIWNATHLSKDMRNKALDLLHAYSAKITIIYLETDIETLFNRNKKRDTVPWTAIEKLMRKWEPPLPSEAHTVKYLIKGELV